MASVNINIRTDAEVKKAAQELFARLGMDMTTAVNIFLRQAISKNTLPLDISPIPDGNVTFGSMKGKVWMASDFDAPLEDFKPITDTNKPKLGGWEGKIWMAEDFDAPLEDFKEYM